MFFGEYEHTIDEKGRLTIPARFRDELASGVVLARGLEGQVDVYPREGWRVNVESRLAELDPLSREARDLRRFFYAGMSDCEPDKQGRVLVPRAGAQASPRARRDRNRGLRPPRDLGSPGLGRAA